MDNQLIPQEEFQTYASLDRTTVCSQTESPSDSGILTTRTLNINSVSNNDLDSLYGLGETSVITDYDTLLVYINELLIRFDASPKYYQKEDYRHLIKTIVDSLRYLYTDSAEINLDIETIFQHLDNIEIELDIKVDKTEGKGLSTNDLTNTLKSYYDLAYQHSLLTNNPHNVTIQQIGAEAAGTAQSLIDDLNLGDIITHDADEFAPALTDDENYITDLEKLNLHAPGSDNQIASDFDIKDLADSDSLRNFWNSKQDPLGFTPENISNKKTTLTDSDIDYPTTNAVNIGLSNKVDKIENYSLISDTDIDRLSYTSGVNTGDQDLSGLVEKKANHSLVPDLEIEKLAGIEENANDYTHPETHPSSILDVVDAVNGVANKFFNERGEMVAVEHEVLTDKNSEAAVQHIDTTVTKQTLVPADMVAIKDSVTGKMVLTPKSNLQTDLTTVNQAITNLQNNKADKTQEAWISPTLLNGWVNNNAIYTQIQYMKDDFGFVTIKGMAISGTSNIIFTLPVGYRPSSYCFFSGATNIGSIIGITSLYVDPDGIVYSYNTTPGTQILLSNIRFKVNQ